jgi:hypothetical protein
MRPLYCVGIGDSITQAGHDEAQLGGWIGRLVDWGLAQSPPVMLWFQGRGPVKNHIAPTNSNVQWNEAFGGLEIGQLEASLTNRLDQNKSPTGFPTFGYSANSIYRPIDFVFFAGGANNMNNPETNTVTWAATLSYLRTLRTALNDRSPNARIVVFGGATDWGDSTAHTKLVAYNAGIAANVYDVFDAENPTNHLIRLDWYTLVGPYNVTDWDDLVHWKTAGYDRLMNTATTGMIAVLGPILTAAAQTDITMGTLSPQARSKLLDHDRNKTAYSPAATHYLHLYSDVGLTTPITNVTNPGYAVVSKTNNTTTWPTISGTTRIKSSGVPWTYASPSGTGNDVRGWKLTDSPTEGAGTVLASNSHAAVPWTVAAGAVNYDVGIIAVTANAGFAVDAVVQGWLNLMFGGVALSQLTTTYWQYIDGNPTAGGTPLGTRQAVTQASVWGAASNGVSVTTTDQAMTHQASGTYWAEYDASSGGNLRLYTTRPLAAGSTGAILAGQLQLVVT